MSKSNNRGSATAQAVRIAKFVGLALVLLAVPVTVVSSLLMATAAKSEGGAVQSSNLHATAAEAGARDALTSDLLAAVARPGGSEAAPGAKASAAKARQHLRCWQYGQLLFEVDQLAVPPESLGRGIRMRKGSGDGSVYLFDTGSAVCLVDGGPEYRKGAFRP